MTLGLVSELKHLKVGSLVAASDRDLFDSVCLDGGSSFQTSWSKISSITYVGEVSVYDIHTESERYVANGMIVHNSMPQPHRIKWSVYTPEEVTEDMIVLNGWGFLPQEGSSKIIEGPSRKLNVRRGFIPEEGHLWCTVDFASQEIRLPAVLSGEPVWLTAFQTGEDLHKLTAYKIWGEEKYNKEYRRRAKVMNFL